MATKFNSPIERLGHASGVTGWGWFFITLIILVIVLLGWLGYSTWQRQTTDKGQIIDNQTGGLEADLAYIRSIEQQDGRYYLTIDAVEWLIGAEAEEQARADGLCQASTTSCITNGFYLRNNATTTDMMLLGESVVVTMQTLSQTASGSPQWDESISLNRWLGLFDDPNSRWYSVPFRLAIDDDEVMSIREQYLP